MRKKKNMWYSIGEKRKASMQKFFSAATYHTVLGESVHLHIKEGMHIRVASARLPPGFGQWAKGCRRSLGKGTGSKGGRWQILSLRVVQYTRFIYSKDTHRLDSAEETSVTVNKVRTAPAFLWTAEPFSLQKSMVVGTTCLWVGEGNSQE